MKQLPSLGFTTENPYNAMLKQDMYFLTDNVDAIPTENTSFPKGTVDMDIEYTKNNLDYGKLKTILNWILPTKGNDLYTIISNPTVENQTIKLDGRTVIITVKATSTVISFSPTTK